MKWSDATKSKLEKLIPRLASDQDGEIVSTVRAIERTIKRDGADWHDFTACISDGSIAAHGQKSAPNGAWYDAPSGGQNQFDDQWVNMAAFCARSPHLLRSRELEFVNDMVGKFKYLSEPTPKQAAWLESIYSRLKKMKDNVL